MNGSIWFSFPKNGYYYSKNEDTNKIKTMYDDIKTSLFPYYDLYFISEHLPSVWIRDFFPISIDGSYVKFKPAFDYMLSEEKVKYKLIDDSLFSKILKKEIKCVDIILDGGNIVYDDKNAIISNKVFRDNNHLRQREIIKILSDVLKRNVIIIEVDPMDITGHSDGYCNFISNNILAVNNMFEIDEEIHKNNMRKFKRNKIELVIFPMYITKNKSGKWFSLEGNYVNFISLEDRILMSTFNNPFEEEIKRKLERINKKIFWINSSPIHKYGGGLHCISWEQIKNKCQN